MERLEQQFGRKLRDLRNAKGMTQEQLAMKANVSCPVISSIERGAMAPSFSMLSHMAKALGVRPKALFDF